MRAALVVCLTLLFVPALTSQAPPALVDSQAFLDQYGRQAPPKGDAAKIQALLAKMTLKEKVAQMTQRELGMFTGGWGDAVKLSSEKARKSFADYDIGSILNVKDQALSQAKWREIVAAIQA